MIWCVPRLDFATDVTQTLKENAHWCTLKLGPLTNERVHAIFARTMKHKRKGEDQKNQLEEGPSQMKNHCNSQWGYKLYNQLYAFSLTPTCFSIW